MTASTREAIERVALKIFKGRTSRIHFTTEALTVRNIVDIVNSDDPARTFNQLIEDVKIGECISLYNYTSSVISKQLYDQEGITVHPREVKKVLNEIISDDYSEFDTIQKAIGF